MRQKVRPKAPEELTDAEARCPDSKFVISCREFFDKRGFLSEAQRDSLIYAGTPNRRYNQFYGYDPEDSDGYDMDPMYPEDFDDMF